MPKYYNALLVIRKEADTHYTAGPTQGHLLNSGGLFVSSTEHIVLDTLLLSTSLGQMPLLGTASLDKELWLQALNMNKDEHWRIRVYATDIDSNGLTVYTNKWGDSILYFASVGGHQRQVRHSGGAPLEQATARELGLHELPYDVLQDAQGHHGA